MSSSTLQIKTIIDPASMPQQVDFAFKYNTLVYGKECDFKKDFSKLGREFGFSSKKLNLYNLPTRSSIYSESPWARDCITCKSSQAAYVLSDTINTVVDSNTAIFTYNSNIAKSISDNTEYLFKFDNSCFNCKSTNIISAGGNFFHCMNALGEYYNIAGECAITSQKKVVLKQEFLNLLNLDNSKIAPKSKKYNFPPNFPDKYREALLNQIELNKKILKSQLDPDSALVIVPNSFFWHIDLEMAVLPNGVVLLHSFEKTLQLLEKYKDEIPDFDDIYEYTKKAAVKSQHLFAKTKQKLEKHNFIVKEVCGFVTKNDLDEIIAYGLNSLVGVTEEGEIFYTLFPDNPDWYDDYIKETLEECGVTYLPYLSNQNSLEKLMQDNGSIRCQHNTIPNKFFLNSKKRQLDDPDLPPAKKMKHEMEDVCDVEQGFSSSEQECATPPQEFDVVEIATDYSISLQYPDVLAETQFCQQSTQPSNQQKKGNQQKQQVWQFFDERSNFKQTKAKHLNFKNNSDFENTVRQTTFYNSKQQSEQTLSSEQQQHLLTRKLP